MNEETNTIGQAIRKIADREGKYLTFSLDHGEYGIGILKVREIIGMMPVTSIPQTPEYVKGVINLRGKIIPVIDLRARFGMDRTDTTERSCIVVVEVGTASGKLHLGVIVDSVSEVISIKADDIEETGSFGAAIEADYILGMAKTGRSVKILLEIDRVLNSDELNLLNPSRGGLLDKPNVEKAELC